jgi:hypothetical protein
MVYSVYGRYNDSYLEDVKILSVYSPFNAANLIAWYDAADTATLFQDDGLTTPAGDTDVVGGWVDKSGQANNSIQATADNKPTLNYNVQNGLPSVRFDGGNDYLRIAAFTGGDATQPTTMFLVASLIAVNATFQVLFGGSDATNRHLIYKDDAADQWACWCGSGVISSTVADTDPHIFTAQFNGASTFLRLDGTQIATGDGGAVVQEGLTLADYGALGLPANCEFHEGLYYDALSTTPQIADIERYMSQKWGIALA